MMTSNLRTILAASALVGGMALVPAGVTTAASAAPAPQHAATQQDGNQAPTITLDGLRTQHAPLYAFVDLAPGEQAQVTVPDAGIVAPVSEGAGGHVATLAAPLEGWGSGEHKVTVLTTTGRTAEATFTANPDAGVVGSATSTDTGLKINAANLAAGTHGSVSVTDETGAVVGTAPTTADAEGKVEVDVPVQWGKGTHTVTLSSDSEQAGVWAQRLEAPTR